MTISLNGKQNIRHQIEQRTHNKGFAKYGRQNIALNTFVILIGFCTLAVGNKKVTAKQAAVILMPVLRKAPNVISHCIVLK